MKRTVRRQLEPGFNTVETVVFMEGLSSIEHYHTRGERPRRVLENINLVIKRPESWGIYGRSLLEIKLLLEVMANIKPYHAGRCILVERGMMRTSG